MPEISTGVFPVNNIKFKIGPSDSAALMIVKDMETFSISMDNNVEEWDPMDQNGWKRRLMTGKSMTIALDGKRHYGDPGNDYVASMALKIGQEATCKVEIDFPDGSTLSGKFVINVTDNGGGGSIEVGKLAFELQSDGEPTYSKA